MVTEFSCEATGRVFGDNPASRGAFLIEVSRGEIRRGFQVRLTTQGEVFLEPGLMTAEHHPATPKIGPVRHPEIKTGGRGESNQLGIRVVGRRVEVLVNGFRVIGPVPLDWDPSPGTISLGVTAEVPNIRVEFDRFEIWEDSIRGDSPGTSPVDALGRTLNLDLEAGTLRDWTVEGNAFGGQPVAGDAVAARRNDMQSRHQGKFWIGTYERGGDELQGTLTSAAFRVTQPFASFLIAGGSLDTTCVELVRKDSGRLISRHRGRRHETFEPVSVDLSEHVGEEIFIRVVDRHAVEDDWNHVNFDDFRLHPAPPDRR